MRVELAFALALALALTPLLYLDDLLNPDPFERTAVRGKLSGVSGSRYSANFTVLLHVNDTLTVDAVLRGCRAESYSMRVTHYASGASYEYSGRGPQLVFPTFTASLGGVYLLEVEIKLANFSCDVDLKVTAVRREKPGYVRLYRLEALVGSLLLAGVVAYAIRRYREVV